MPVVTKEVIKYQCSFCHSLFETERKASNCEKKCIEAVKAKDIAEKVKDEMRLTCTTISEVEQYMEKHLKELSGVDTIKVNLDVRYSPFTSNSHAAPLNGVSNWCSREADKPTSYEGWVGNITIKWTGVCKIKKYHGSSDYIASDEIRMFRGVNTLSGGAGNSDCRYGVTLFCEDFPLIFENQNKQNEKVSEASATVQNKLDEAERLTEKDEKWLGQVAIFNENSREIEELQTKLHTLMQKEYACSDKMRAIKEGYIESICKEAKEELEVVRKDSYNITSTTERRKK